MPAMQTGRDTQRSRVYGWESAVLYMAFRKTSENKIRQLLERIFTDLDYPIPEIVFRKCNTSSWCSGQARITIATGTYSFSPHYGIAIHEAAHVIAEMIRPASEGAHGPTFMRVFLMLLQKYAPPTPQYLRLIKYDKAEYYRMLEETAKAKKIKIASRARFTWKKLTAVPFDATNIETHWLNNSKAQRKMKGND
jgi:hypothetical protein